MKCYKGRRRRLLHLLFSAILCLQLSFSIYTCYKLRRTRPAHIFSDYQSVLNNTNTTSSTPRRIWTTNASGYVYVYSVHRRCRNNPIIVANGWEYDPPRGKSPRVNYTCCVRTLNGSLYASPAHAKFGFYERTNLMTIRVVCRDPVVHGNYTVLVVRSTMYTKLDNFNPASLCPNSSAEYMTPTDPIVPGTYRDLQEAEAHTVDENCLPFEKRNPRRHKSEKFSLAICAKLAFGNLEPNLVIEWIEYNVKMGVSKIAVYVYMLNPQAFRIFRHFEKLGFIILELFNMPLKTDTEIKRPQKQHWNDEQVALYDCHDQLRLFKYVAVLDFDEFIVPNVDKDFIGLSERLHASNPIASMFHFKVRFHYFFRNNSRSGDDLYFEKYLNNSCPIAFKRKMLMIPSRVPLTGTYTHGFKEFLSPYNTSTTWANWVDTSLAYVNHYRRCPVERDCLQKLKCKTSNISMHINQPLKQAMYAKKKLLLG